MKLPYPGEQYSQKDEGEARRLIEDADADNLKRNENIQLNADQRLILTSPNGTLYYITVDDLGALSATAV